jgi:hypothetical protein
MQVPPTLEDQSYPGRSGGYVARITGKLLHEAATRGSHQLFLPAPRSTTTHYVYSGPDATFPPLVQVPHEFYSGLYERVKAVYGIGLDSKSCERVVTYDGNAYTFHVNLVSEPVLGVAIAISVGGN